MNHQMASYQLLKNNNLNETQTSRWSTHTSRGGSKAQLCLHKILQIISTIPPEATSKPTTPINYTSEASSVHNVKNEHGILNIDLNISEPEPEESESPAVEEKKLAADVDVNVNGEEGFMGLLIEAAKLIFGEFKDDDDDDDGGKQSLSSSEDSPKTRLKRKKAFWALDLCEEVTDTSPPVVRSKRGRVQVLPCKYRDSVLEPVTRFSRKRSVVVGNKRRSR